MNNPREYEGSEPQSVFDKYLSSDEIKRFKEITCDGEDFFIVEQDKNERFIRLEYTSQDNRTKVTKEAFLNRDGENRLSRERRWVEGRPSSVTLVSQDEISISIYGERNSNWMSFGLGSFIEDLFVQTGFKEGNSVYTSFNVCVSSEEAKEIMFPKDTGRRFNYNPHFDNRWEGKWQYRYLAERSRKDIEIGEEIFSRSNPPNMFSFKMEESDDGYQFTGTEVSTGIQTFLRVPNKISVTQWDQLLWTEDRSWQDFRKIMEVSVGWSAKRPDTSAS